MSGTRTYLEITDPNALHPAWSGVPGARVDRVEGCPSSYFRYLSQEVGRAYGWVDRLTWTDDEIARHLADPAISLWVMTVRNAPAGYFELRHECGSGAPAQDRRGGMNVDEGGSVEIAYFGLLPEFVGRGLGGHLLSVAVERAFESGARRVWLHTCTRDSPAALPNYLKRGFVPFRTEPL
jgi:GNAT superfamily N-acetyltransferase